VQVIMEQKSYEKTSTNSKILSINRWKSKWLALTVILICLFFVCIYLVHIMRKRVNRYIQLRRYRIINQRFINMGLALNSDEDDSIFG
jgi:threonine/homoserine/homoserine lactone efflux protein